MRSLKEIKRIAKKLSLLSITKDNKVINENVSQILDMTDNHTLYKIGIKTQKTENISLLKEYMNYIKSLIIEDTMIVTTAFHLNGNQKKEVIQRLIPVFNKNNIKFETDQEIIAGIKIKSGWIIEDGSLKHKIDTLNF